MENSQQRFDRELKWVKRQRAEQTLLAIVFTVIITLLIALWATMVFAQFYDGQPDPWEFERPAWADMTLEEKLANNEAQEAFYRVQREQAYERWRQEEADRQLTRQQYERDLEDLTDD